MGGQKGELIVLSVLSRADGTTIWGTNCTIGVVWSRWHDDMVKCRSTHEAKVQCFKVNGKFLFISVTFTILVAGICSLN